MYNVPTFLIHPNRIMTYEEFKFSIMDRLQAEIKDPKTISIQQVTRNNGCRLDGLIIMEGERNIAPTIYLDPFFEEYQSGTSFSVLYEKILSVYRQNRPESDINIRCFTDYENAKDHIAFKLIHRQRNEELLRGIPFIPYLDLAIVFYCLIDFPNEPGNGTILIHNSHLDYWNISLQDLFENAQKNTPRMLHQSLRDIQDVINDLASKLPSAGTIPKASCVREKNEPSMYILSNRENLYGAGCLLYQGLLARYARQMDSDFYILPSSVHEVILIPTSSDKNLQKMSEMVESVNSTALLPEEILSDHAYYYSRDKDEILM